MIKLSVITPVSRTANILSFLNSLMRQTTNKDFFEIILSGECPVIPEKFLKSLNIKLISVENKHPGIRRNIAVNKSNGSFLLFLDDDTVPAPTHLENVLNLLNNFNNTIISGPNFDNRQELKYKIPKLIEENILTEGLVSHKEFVPDKEEVDFHNIPLCNMALSKDLFKEIGNFNEFASYYIDDVEFFYIANKRGIKFLKFKSLSIQHNVRPFMVEYYKYKFKSRFNIGKIFPYYSELYRDSFQIKLVFLVGLAFNALLIFKKFKLLILSFSLYLLLLIVSVSMTKCKFIFKLFLIPSIFFTHFIVVVGFFVGFLKGIIILPKKFHIFKLKRERYKKCFPI